MVIYISMQLNDNELTESQGMRFLEIRIPSNLPQRPEHHPVLCIERLRHEKSNSLFVK